MKTENSLYIHIPVYICIYYLYIGVDWAKL